MGVCKMRVTFTIFAFTLLFAAAFAEVTQDEGVYVLTNDNFDSWLAEQEFALIEFYAPWCGHCKNLAPHYAQAAQELAGSSSAKLAKVDATENPELGQKFEVRGYPTLYWFTKDSGYAPAQYNGPREAPGIVQWVTKQTKNTFDVLASQDALSETRKEFSPNAVVVLYGNSEAYSSLLTFSRNVQEIGVYQITDESQFGAYKNGDVVVYPSHKDPVVTQSTVEEEIFGTIMNNAFPPVVPFDGSHFQRLAAENSFVVIAVEDLSDSSKSENLVSLLNNIAATRDQVGIMYGDSNQLARGVQGAGASGEVFPTIIAIDVSNNNQIAFDETLDWNEEVVGKWLDGLFDGSTTTFKKSQPIPEDNNGPVTTLVAKNFDEVTSGKSVLVKYYAPWCGHCKTLAPVYEELGAAFKGKDVVIAEIDATANYIAESRVSGFPTLIWYDAQGNSEIYEGARDLDALTAFVNSKLGNNHQHDEL